MRFYYDKLDTLSSNGSKSVIIKIEENARWSRKTHKGQ